MSGGERHTGRELPVIGAGDGHTVDRRQALKVMALATAAPGMVRWSADSGAAGPTDGASLGAPPPPQVPSNPKARGWPWDPDLIAPTVPWERVLTEDELASLAVLCDLIIPADQRSPSASAVGAHAFIDEWVSAPYEGNERDRVLIRGGLVWLDAEAARRFGNGRRFRELSDEERRAICDDIAYVKTAAEEHKAAARFFDRVRFLTSTAFWTTEEGMRDLQYVGNVPLARWDPPPPEVLRHIGLEEDE